MSIGADALGMDVTNSPEGFVMSIGADALGMHLVIPDGLSAPPPHILDNSPAYSRQTLYLPDGEAIPQQQRQRFIPAITRSPFEFSKITHACYSLSKHFCLFIWQNSNVSHLR